MMEIVSDAIKIVGMQSRFSGQEEFTGTIERVVYLNERARKE